MIPFDRPYTTFCWSVIVNVTLSCTDFLSYLTLNNMLTLKSGLEVTQVIQTGTIGKLGCGFRKAFHNGSILHHFRDKASYWLKIVIFSYPFAFDAPVRGYPSEYCHPVWCEKNIMVGLPGGNNNFEDNMFSGVNRIPACVR